MNNRRDFLTYFADLLHVKIIAVSFQVLFVKN
jgi:hypothetical protein